MGISERPSEAFLDRLGTEFSFERPVTMGSTRFGQFRRCTALRARFFALGGNFLSATPDTEYTAEAIRRCALTVHVSTKLNRAHLITGERANPPVPGRTEIDQQSSGPQFVTTENSMAVVQASRGFLPPASPELLSEPAIVSRLARATLRQRTTVDWEELIADYDQIRSDRPGNSRIRDYNRRVRQIGVLPAPVFHAISIQDTE